MLARRPVSVRPHLRVLPPTGGDDRTRPAFLHDPTPEAVRRAIEGNQRQWLLRLARYGGELIQRDGGIVWHDGPEGGEIQVPFPRFDVQRIGEQLDALVSRLREGRPPRPVRIWLSGAARPVELPLRLLARGFRPGFRPRWMRLDL